MNMNEDFEETLERWDILSDLNLFIKRLKIVELVLNNESIDDKDKKKIIQIVLENFSSDCSKLLERLFKLFE